MEGSVILRSSMIGMFSELKLSVEPEDDRPLSFSSYTYPFTPFLGGLLLNCRVCLCLNLGGPLRGVIGPWLGAGGPREVVSLILAVPGWLVLCLLARWRGEGNEEAPSQTDSVLTPGSASSLAVCVGARKTAEMIFRKYAINQ